MKCLKYYRRLIKFYFYNLFNYQNKKDFWLESINQLQRDCQIQKIDQNIQKKIKKLSKFNSNLIYFHNNWGGGSNIYLQSEINELKNTNCIFILIYEKQLRKIRCNFIYKNQFYSFHFPNKNVLLNFFSSIKVYKIIINQIVTYPSLQNVFELIKKLKNLHTSTTMLIHDFYCLCPTIHLVKKNGELCNILQNGSCDCKGQSKRRKKAWHNFLSNNTNEIIAFSQNSKEIISNIYPNLSDKINIIPHKVSLLRKVNVNKNHQILNIGIMGNISKIKGSDLVLQISELIIKNNLSVKIIVIGEFDEQINSAIKVLGKYQKDNLPTIIEEHQIDLIFISSICPETFSYTTHEAMQIGLKVACFDLGAQAEYLRKYDQSLIISKINASTALSEIIDFSKK